MPERRSREPTTKAAPGAVRDLAKSLSGDYRNRCPDITETRTLGEHCVDHLGGSAAAQALGQRQGDAVLALCGGAQDDGLGVGKLGHGVVSVFGPASCGTFYDPEPRRARGGSSGSAGDQRACSPSPKALSVMRFRRLA